MTNEECIKMLKSKLDGNTDTSYEWCECVRLAIKALEQPTADDCVSRKDVLALAKRGKWIEKTGEGFDAWAECSECGCVNPFEDDFNYCPNCGADMRVVQDDNS